MLMFDKATYLPLQFRFIFSVRLDNILWRSDVLRFSKFINIVSIHAYNFIEFIILLYTFLVTSFSRYKEYIICLISFSKFSDVSLAFNRISALGNLWNICLGVNILKLLCKSEGSLLPFCCLLKSKIISAISTTFFGF